MFYTKRISSVSLMAVDKIEGKCAIAPVLLAGVYLPLGFLLLFPSFTFSAITSRHRLLRTIQ